MNSLVQLETHWGKPIQATGRKVTIQSCSLQINIPFLNGSLVWNRPVSVLTLSDDGADQILPVRDVTRIVEVLLFISAIIAASIATIVLSRRAR